MKLCRFALVILLLLTAGPAFASSGISVTESLQKIITAQGLNRLQDIDCGQVANDQFEELGDAVMAQIHPGEQHEWMDNMMGGEGSDSLAAMHIAIGQNYLGCNTYHYELSNSGMMRSIMMAGGMMDGYFYPQAGKNSLLQKNLDVTGGYQWLWLISLINTILIWVILVLIIIALIKWLKLKK